MSDLWTPESEYLDDSKYTDDELAEAYLGAEYRYADIDDRDGRTILGTVVRYGDVSTANATGMMEVFEVGAFGDVSEIDTTLNIQHDRRKLIGRTQGGGLEFTDSKERLLVAATVPETRDGDDALLMVEKGLLRGFSVEYRARQERFLNAARSIQKARLPGLALVDRPAYDDSVIAEIRQTGAGIEGVFPYDQDTIISATGKTRKERVKAGAFSYAVKAPDREINLILGDNSKPLGSKMSGSLKLEDTPKGLKFKVEKLPRTSYVADFLSMLRSKTVTPGVVPFFSPTPGNIARRLFSDGRGASFTEPEEGHPGIFRRVIRSGLLTALSILFRAPRGNPGRLSRLPRRIGRPGAGIPNTLDSVLPRQGDIVRGSRVIRGGIDIGPVRRRWI